MTQGLRDYQRLDAADVKRTVDRLTRRIEARFPDRNLRHVCTSLSLAIDDLLIRPRSRWYSVLRVASWIAIGVLLLGVIIAIVVVVAQAANNQEPESVWSWIQIIESAINDAIFLAVAIFFLWQVPLRVQRAHDLGALHRLRSLAHVIDMHQLTKDPDRLRDDFQPTSETLNVDLTAAQLSHYLDYCSEMLSLVSKTAALFAEHSTDNTVLQSVEALESMTTGMSRKIWQKIALLPGRPHQAGA